MKNKRCSINNIIIFFSIALFFCCSDESKNNKSTTIKSEDSKEEKLDHDKSSKIKEKLDNIKIETEFDKLFHVKKLNISDIDIKNKDHIAILKLICVQSFMLDEIKAELKKYSKKKGHWIWYVYATTKPGDNDPYKVSINEDTTSMYLKLISEDIYNKWISLLKNINTNFEKNKEYLPEIDHGRLVYCYNFWLKVKINKDHKLATKRSKEVKLLFKKLKAICQKYKIQ